jgi:cytochrome P450
VALAWTFHELSRNPAIEADLVADVDRVLAGRIPTIGDLDALPGLRMLLEETMRLNPPVWYTSRRAVVDDAIAGYPIPAKTVAIISPYTIHRHPAFWDDPERFDPGRFSPERSKKRHRYAYFPFMGGRHQCIGQSFSMLKMQLIIALLLQRCRIRAVPGHPVEPKPQTSLRMRHGMMVTMEKRG